MVLTQDSDLVPKGVALSGTGLLPCHINVVPVLSLPKRDGGGFPSRLRKKDCAAFIGFCYLVSF